MSRDTRHDLVPYLVQLYKTDTGIQKYINELFEVYYWAVRRREDGIIGKVQNKFREFAIAAYVEKNKQKPPRAFNYSKAWGNLRAQVSDFAPYPEGMRTFIPGGNGTYYNNDYFKDQAKPPFPISPFEALKRPDDPNKAKKISPVKIKSPVGQESIKSVIRQKLRDAIGKAEETMDPKEFATWSIQLLSNPNLQDEEG